MIGCVLRTDVYLDREGVTNRFQVQYLEWEVPGNMMSTVNFILQLSAFRHPSWRGSHPSVPDHESPWAGRALAGPQPRLTPSIAGPSALQLCPSQLNHSIRVNRTSSRARAGRAQRPASSLGRQAVKVARECLDCGPASGPSRGCARRATGRCLPVLGHANAG